MSEWLGICCNDHRNGNFVGKVFAVNIGDVHIGCCIWGSESRCRHVSKKEFSIGRVRFRVRGYCEWYGNWCWDAAAMEIPDIARVLNYMRGKRCRGKHVYFIESGPEEFWKAWDSDRNLTTEDIDTALGATP